LIHRAYINYSYNKKAQIRIGRFKQPFSLEEQTSANAIDFMERSYGNQMVAGQRNGAMVFGSPINGLTYAISAYQDGFNELSNTNQVGTLGIGRVTANLAELRGGSTDTVIHLGAAVDKGKYEVTPTTSTDTGLAASAVTRATILSFRTENRGMSNAYRAQIAGDNVTNGYGVSGNNAANVTKKLQGLELALSTGAFKFQTEHFDSKYSSAVKNYCVIAVTGGCSALTLVGTTSMDLSATAKYYEFMYNLTGESWANSYRSGAFTTIKPKANFSTGSGGGWGAWQLGVRYSTYQVSEPTAVSTSDVSSVSTRVFQQISGTSTYYNRGENSENAQTITLGLNWILNPNSRVLMNYSETNFDRPVTYLSTTTPATLGSTSNEKVLSIRTQLNF
jgi:phosphate-selective porin OprO/OprP